MCELKYCATVCIWLLCISLQTHLNQARNNRWFFHLPLVGGLCCPSTFVHNGCSGSSGDVQGLRDSLTSGLLSWGALAHHWGVQASQFWESLTHHTLAIPRLVQGCTALPGLLLRKFELRCVFSVISVLLACGNIEVDLLRTSPHDWSDLAAAAARRELSMEDKHWHTMKCVHSTTNPRLKLGIWYLGV